MNQDKNQVRDSDSFFSKVPSNLKTEDDEDQATGRARINSFQSDDKSSSYSRGATSDSYASSAARSGYSATSSAQISNLSSNLKDKNSNYIRKREEEKTKRDLSHLTLK